MVYTCTKFSFDSSRGFSFRARTHTDTDATAHLTHTSATGVNNYRLLYIYMSTAATTF